MPKRKPARDDARINRIQASGRDPHDDVPIGGARLRKLFD
jgi:hypothetical protein